MLVFETTYSRYEVDTVNKRIRRTRGDRPPTERQGPDNVWKPYVSIDKCMGGYLITWDREGRGTLTSRVVSERQETVA